MVLAIFCCTELIINIFFNSNFFLCVLNSNTVAKTDLYLPAYIRYIYIYFFFDCRFHILTASGLFQWTTVTCIGLSCGFWLLAIFQKVKSKTSFRNVLLQKSKKQNKVWRLQSYKVLCPQKWQETFSPESSSRFHVNKVRKLQQE